MSQQQTSPGRWMITCRLEVAVFTAVLSSANASLCRHWHTALLYAALAPFADAKVGHEAHNAAEEGCSSAAMRSIQRWAA